MNTRFSLTRTLMATALGLALWPALGHGQGAIQFAESLNGDTPGGSSCSISLPDKYSAAENIQGTGRCDEPNYHYFRFDNVNSAAVVEFWDRFGCGMSPLLPYSNDITLIVKTTSNNLTTKWIAFSELELATVGEPGSPVAGVMLLAKDRVGKDTGISCVRFMRP
ncbi:hypothetical protein N8H41_19570 [Pseudomonas vlassakiae]|uniref:hypothetical protein n=1 Tax=Pseudomonas TaxID=286 RepID=UPI0012E19928|nr:MULTISPECIES: hypothetical protein [Pseudomonas]MCU0126178.1 hypothetical protein [Pseudomonas vlassakiae]